MPHNESESESVKLLKSIFSPNVPPSSVDALKMISSNKLHRRYFPISIQAPIWEELSPRDLRGGGLAHKVNDVPSGLTAPS